MTSLTALLLVLTLTGTSVASVFWVAECQREPSTSGHRHGDIATSAGPMISTAHSCSDPSISGSQYVIEHRAMAGPAASLSPTAPEVVGAVARAVLRRAVDAWVKPPLVLRL
jgi:hypothetical protein